MSSSPDTLETLIKNDARVAAASNAVAARREEEDAQQGVIAGGRMRASAVLMQLISCGSIPAAPKRETGPGGASAARYAAERRLPRGRSDLSSSPGADAFSWSIGIGAGMEREYFSGSLVETKKLASGNRAGVGELGALKRSSSYNADRGRESTMNTGATTTSGGCKLELAAEEADGVRARCIPAGRKPSSSSKKSPTTHVHLISSGSIPAAAKQDAGLGDVGAARYTEQLPRGRSDLSSSTAADTFSGSISAGMEREYFSSSLVETRKTASGDRAGHGGELGALKRSSSYNADRGRESTINTASTTSGGCKLELAAEDVDGVRARCIPAAARKPSSSKKSPTTHVHVSSRRGDQPETTDQGRTD